VPGAENIELPGYTHYSYFLNPEAWRLIHRLLALRAPAPRRRCRRG
jgi:hypothetical protein